MEKHIQSSFDCLEALQAVFVEKHFDMVFVVHEVKAHLDDFNSHPL
jgi:hypothetical protein